MKKNRFIFLSSVILMFFLYQLVNHFFINFNHELIQNRTNNQPNQVASNNCPQHYPLGAPEIVGQSKDSYIKRSLNLCRTSYAVQFDTFFKTPISVSEIITADNVNRKSDERENNFQPDPTVNGNLQATLEDYQHSGFDRGHMAPFVDMKVNNDKNSPQLNQELTSKAENESFFLTNMVPQVGPNMNRGIWKNLETKVRLWAKDRGEIYVISGPIYETYFDTIGKSKVAVPNYLYKVIIDPKTMESISFLMPNVQVKMKTTRVLDRGNKEHPQTLPENAVDCNNYCNLTNFVVDLSLIEDKTGLKFYPQLNEKDKQKLERTSDKMSWKLK